MYTYSVLCSSRLILYSLAPVGSHISIYQILIVKTCKDFNLCVHGHGCPNFELCSGGYATCVNKVLSSFLLAVNEQRGARNIACSNSSSSSGP